MTGLFLAAAISILPVGEIPVPGSFDSIGTRGLSGITHVAGDKYYAARDAHGYVYELDIPVDCATGAAQSCSIKRIIQLSGRKDIEGIAFDPLRNLVWVSDEHDGTISAYDPLNCRAVGKSSTTNKSIATGKSTATDNSAVTGKSQSSIDGSAVENVDVPKVFSKFKFNYSFESLALSKDALEMWTCNEEALACDGAAASQMHGSAIRIQKFTRMDKAEKWRPGGQWIYVTDPIGGRLFFNSSRSGVSDMLCLNDGTVLTLEREVSIKKGKFLPSFRCRIYQLDFADADDVSDCASLKDISKRPVNKKLVFDADTGFAMYEGICLGPKLNDGSQSVLLISDGDDGAANRILALRVKLLTDN